MNQHQPLPQGEPEWPHWWGVTDGCAPNVVLRDHRSTELIDGLFPLHMSDQEIYSYVVTPQ